MQKIWIALAAVVLFSACKQKGSNTVTRSDNKIDAARNFIRAALDGKFDEAKSYMLQDSVNLNFLDVAQRSYERSTQEVKDGYRASSIRFPGDLADLNDSTAIVIYANSYKNDPDTLRLVKTAAGWLVDLKYLYQHDQATVPTQPQTDTAK